MKRCRSCTILDKYDRLNAAGYCSWCVSRGYHKRPLSPLEVSHREVPCTDLRANPTETQAAAFVALVKHGTPSGAGRALGKKTESICAVLKSLEYRVGHRVYVRLTPFERRAEGARVKLTAAGERLIEQLSEVI